MYLFIYLYNIVSLFLSLIFLSYPVVVFYALVVLCARYCSCTLAPLKNGTKAFETMHTRQGFSAWPDGRTFEFRA